MRPQLLQSTVKQLLWGSECWVCTPPSLPLLLKYIDVRDDLSIQVHPDDALARRRHDKSGKTEMWYVMDADPGASLLAGFVQPITPEEYDRRVTDDTLHEVLQRYPVASGDVFYLPAGTPHSIGSGIRIAEIQQPSDVTYRISDFGRLDADGRPRELHTELAREAMNFAACGAKVTYTSQSDKEVVLVRSPYFTTSLYDLTRPMTLTPQGICAVMIVHGEGAVGDLPVKMGDAVLVSEATEISGNLRFLSVRISPYPALH